MNFLRRKVRDWLNQSDYEKCSQPVAFPSGSELRSPAVSFNIRAATGGYVIETGFYDHTTDRHISSLYVVTEFEQLGEEISRIYSLENLKR